MKSTFLRMLGTAAICLLLTAAFSCKSKKQATDTSDAEKARMEQMEAERRAREEEEARRRAEEERLAREREAEERAAYDKLNGLFNNIANASSESAADRSINEALNMFASQGVPVLIIIFEDEQEDVVDYDEPTTINDYLHYLKVVKRKPDNVERLEFNNNGKISEIILKKNF
jgi:hypothetical protein